MCRDAIHLSLTLQHECRSVYDRVMFPQVSVTFSDFEKMERVCSVLLEKLDKSVCVGMPQFYHSAECLSQVRYKKHCNIW